MIRSRPLLLGLLLLLATACTANSGTRDTNGATGPISPEDLTRRAESRFKEHLDTQRGDRKAATEQTAEYLKALPGVKEVQVRGSDTLFVIMTDGNELLMMLGRDRL